MSQYIARDKNGKLRVHEELPKRATYGRGVNDSYWESSGAVRNAWQYEKLAFSSLRWSDEPVEIDIKDGLNK